MYVRLEFEDENSDSKLETHYRLTGNPSGTCLTSLNSRWLTSKDMHEKNKNVYFWYLDEAVLTRYYFGENALIYIRNMPGVKSLTVLSEEEDIESNLYKYI
jgi:hypothetical protein